MQWLASEGASPWRHINAVWNGHELTITVTLKPGEDNLPPHKQTGAPQ